MSQYELAQTVWFTVEAEDEDEAKQMVSELLAGIPEVSDSETIEVTKL